MVLVATLLFVLVVNSNSFILDGLPKAVNIYVSTHGNDHNNGQDVHHPVKTIRKAVSLLSVPSLKNTDVTINLMHGYHDLDAPVYIHHQSSHTLTIKAYNDQEVHVTGGKRIPSNSFHRVSDQAILHRLPPESRNKVYQVKLSDAGISDLGQLTAYGFYKIRQAPLEIFYNGEPLRLARWPNEGFINIKNVLSGTHGRRFSYNSERPRRWSSEDDLWAYGYWYWSWADLAAKIHSIDAVHHVVELQHATHYGLRIGHFNNQSNENIKYSSQGGYFRFLNVLGEIDEPGEYYIDRSSGILYLWPPTSNGLISNHDIIYSSLIEDCLTFDGASNLVFKGFTLEACRRFGLKGHNVRNVNFEQMEIKNSGSYNIFCPGDSRNVTITRCNLHDGDGGIYLQGGDRTTLTPSGNLVTDNLIWRFSRETGVGANALDLSGVGARVRYNNMHTGQYTAIRWHGNDHVMEYNHVHHTCQNSSDCGGIHAGRDWTSRGNIIRKNHIHHTLRFFPGADVRGIMLDDEYSSVTIEDNVFYDNEVHANIGGGRDNIIRKNVFYNATLSALQVDHRGTDHRFDGTLYKSLQEVPFKSGLWASRYPKLAVIEANSPNEPRGNQIYNNIFFGAKTSFINGLVQNPSWFNVTDNGYTDLSSDFFNVNVKDFRPRCLLSEFTNRVHFPTPVQLNEIGPRYPVGPSYNTKKYAEHSVSTLKSPSPCTTYAPVTNTPKGSFLPDGSAPNTIHSTPKHGCWLYVEKCTAHPELISKSSTQFHQDSDPMASVTQSICLHRVSHYVQYCGTESYFHIIFGPTGAMTLGGNQGCFFAEYGCPDHNYHVPKTGIIHHDAYAERERNGSNVQQNCLSRALAQYRYCGSHADYPYTSIFLPTGKTVTAGAGCWIQMDACAADSSIHTSFYDALGASNAGSDISTETCFARAKYYWYRCGSRHENPVTAFYRPVARSYTYPPS
ncbi:uncharacterized protein LOC133192335 [Saccostrea echinata]|uniref:uncharacterized protein LOC133192335 n=1 Tax=Saccostrea echinata TaxID=191078 RepID=UPI002A822487|nr:uncharacterized protein LOC133192335 [Saccostrea echinata]